MSPTITSEVDTLDLTSREHMTKKKALLLIEDLENVIERLRAKVLAARSRIEKNNLYNQIENRRTQLKWAESQLENK
jgi:hypothetical protein